MSIKLVGLANMDKLTNISNQTADQGISLLAEQNRHRQSRSYLKTVAQLVGRDSDNGFLWGNTLYQDGLNPTKNVISKTQAILGNLLFQEWQWSKDSSGLYRISNLSELSHKVNNMTPQMLKRHLLSLRGYRYQLINLLVDLEEITSERLKK